MKEIATALVKAQKAFAPALKTSTNPHFKSRYADLAACVEAVVDALNTNGIFLNQQTSESEGGVIVETVFIHESGETLSCGKLHVPAAKQDPQGYGSALTYARRYSLMAACGIAPEDDDGNAASKKTGKAETFAAIASAKGVTPTAGAMENFDDAEQKFLADLAEKVTEMAPVAISGAIALLDKSHFENEEKIAVWSLLDSKTRSAIKRAKEKQSATEITSQA